jgi:hypothetical protein
LSLFCFFLLLFLSSALPSVSVQAQLLIQDERGFEVVFSRSDSQYQQLTSPARTGRYQLALRQNSTQRIADWDAGYPDGEPFYVTDAFGNLGVGGLKPADADANRPSPCSLSETEPDSAFESMELVFDLFYLPAAHYDYTLELRYRVEKGEWQSVPGATISRSVLREQSGEGDWNSISIQTAINGMILTQNEEIELEWVVRSEDHHRPHFPSPFTR